jgi:photosystem II stability/assembly factor-like uncharacterized protein
MSDSPLDLSRFVDATPGPTPEVRERLAATLQMLIESEQIGHKQRQGRWQRTTWTHRVWVVGVAAAILVVFFVPLPHVSLFHNLVTPAKTTPATTPSVTSAKVTPTAVTGADGYLWMLGAYPCATGTCRVLMRSADGGKSFVKVGTLPPSVNALVFANREDGYAYFQGGTTVKSVLYWTGDGGRSWRLAPAAFQESQSLSIVTTEGRAYVLAYEDCTVNRGCKTLDFGSSTVTSDSWTLRSVPIDVTQNNVGLAVFGAKVWLIVVSDGGSYAKVLVSDDGGASFTNLPSTGMEGLACRVRATSATTLWGFCATGLLGYAVRSTDGGRVFSTLSGWIRGHRPAANGGLILPLSNTEAVFQPGVAGMWLTRDGGAHFSAVRFSSLWLSDSYGFYITFASTTTWLVLGINEGPGGSNPLWRTTNGGRTWQPLKAPTVPTLLPAVDLSATPKGWVPVAYGDAQISGPPSFPVVYPGQGFPCKGASVSGPGGLLVGARPGFAIDCVVERHPTMVYLVSVHNPSLVDFVPVQKKSIMLNGVRVYRVLTAASYVGYYAPSLGVELTARGPLARRIVNTLTRSPRTVALASGPAPAVLPSWQKLSFQSLTFAAPVKWPVEYTLSDYPFGWICGGEL